MSEREAAFFGLSVFPLVGREPLGKYTYTYICVAEKSKWRCVCVRVLCSGVRYGEITGRGMCVCAGVGRDRKREREREREGYPGRRERARGMVSSLRVVR